MTMTSKKSAADIRDYVLQGYRVYQDLMYVAGQRDDIATLRSVYDAFDRSFEDFLEKPTGTNVQILRLQLERATSNEERAEVSEQLKIATARYEVSQRFRKAKSDITFGLAAKFLEELIEGEKHRAVYELLAGHLPTNLVALTQLFASISDRKIGDEWGWHWWDFNADGRVHTVDSTTRPNRLFVVRALQILGGMPDPATATLPHNEDLVWLFDTANQNSVPALIGQILENRAAYRKVLTDAQLDLLNRLLEMLADSKRAQDLERENRLIATPLSPIKIAEFKANVLHAVRDESKTRVFARIVGIYRDKTSERPGKSVPSWGYNQLDDKGAFVDDWHVSFSGWGEQYGRGMAQTEEQRFLEAIIEGAAHKETVKGALASEIERSLKHHALEKPVIVHTLGYTSDFSGIGRNTAFVPSYDRNRKPTIYDGIDGFSGVLHLANQEIPVLRLSARKQALRGCLVVANFAKFLSWTQYSPVDEDDKQDDVSDFLYVKVTDLNTDDTRRQKLVAENPDWLKKEADPDRFLRTRTIVNVYEKLSVVVENGKQAICFRTALRRKESEGKQ
jgi:hypothetical protein